MENLELILVDDGSPDSSGAICDEYACCDSRVKVIHQVNSGVSAARNRGLDEATGEFVGFVDADDWVTEPMYETMYAEAVARNAEIVMCDIRAVCEDGTEREDTIWQLDGDCCLLPKDRTSGLMPDFGGSACRCIYRRSLLEEHHIRFPEGLKFSEDRIFNIYAMGHANCVVYLKRPLYIQFVNSASCVHRYHKDYFDHVKLAAVKTEEAVQSIWNNDPGYQRTYRRHFYYGALGAVYNVKHGQPGMSWRQRLNEIRRICEDEQLRTAISDIEVEDSRRRMILKKRYLALYFSDTRLHQKVENFREVYRKNGMIGVLRKCAGK